MFSRESSIFSSCRSTPDDLCRGCGYVKSLDNVWSDTKDQKEKFQKKRNKSFDNQGTRWSGGGGKPRFDVGQSVSQIAN